MKTLDIIKLATKGYTVADIKTIAEDEKTNGEVVQLALNSASMENYKELLSLCDISATGNAGTLTAPNEPAAEQANEPAQEINADPETKNDKVRELEQELEKIRGELKNAQSLNLKQDISGNNPVDINTELNSFANDFI